MGFITHDVVPLNRSEHGYVAIEGLAATMIQPYLMRLNVPVDEAFVRRVCRELVTAYPKLRACIEPGLHQYHFRILPEGPLIDQLFDLAFRVEPHVAIDDPAALEAWHTSLVNEVVPLERGVCLRVRFVPHPQRPVIVLAVPHVFADGLTMVHLVGQILRGLNGLGLAPMPIEAPALIGSVAPAHWWQWPRQVWRSRAHKVAESRRLKGLHVQQLPTRLGAHYSTTALRHHDVPTPTAEMRQAARALGVSLNTFLIAALAQVFLDQAPGDPQAAAVIRISVNLRRYYPAQAGHGPLWGNHVAAFLVVEQDAGKPLLARVRSVDAAIKEGQARFARREMAWTYLWDELLPLLGRTLIGHIGVKMKRANRFPQISAHATSLGDVGHVSAPGAAVRMDQFIATVNSISPLPALIELNGRLSLPTSWQRGETTVAEVDGFLARFDATVARLVAEVALSHPA